VLRNRTTFIVSPRDPCPHLESLHVGRAKYARLIFRMLKKVLSEGPPRMKGCKASLELPRSSFQKKEEKC